MSLSDYYVSGLLKMQTIGTPSPSTVQTLPERFTSTPTPTPTGVDTEVNDGKLGEEVAVSCLLEELDNLCCLSKVQIDLWCCRHSSLLLCACRA